MKIYLRLFRDIYEKRPENRPQKSNELLFI